MAGGLIWFFVVFMEFILPASCVGWVGYWLMIVYDKLI